ncbi:MAG: SDR family NAD(P)-dependent oxidoreductase, partial [Planctomycetes bacterium]|nr:SDR family NAD(P)-dependent oxidoreductase [Planctomycetota bacterium]
MDLGLAKKVALVTGGGTGVGKAIVGLLAEEGVRVAIVGKIPDEVNETVAALEKAGKPARGRAIDIRDRAEVRRFAAEIAGAWGPIQILVNNAAIHPPPQRFTDLQDQDWQETIDVTLLGARNCTLAVVAGMKAAKWGRVVTVGSLIS